VQTNGWTVRQAGSIVATQTSGSLRVNLSYVLSCFGTANVSGGVKSLTTKA